MSTTLPVYVGIQYARAIAATLVLAGHAMDILPGSRIPTEYNFGGIGVDIFFVISGFIMWVTTEARQMTPVDFWLRRVRRIVPLYWLFTSVIVVIGMIAPGLLGATKVTTTSAIQSYLFIPHYYSNSTYADLIAPLLGPGWTLNYEMFFYLVFGICLLPSLFRNRLQIIAVVLTTLVIMGACVNSSAPIWIVYTNQLLMEFLFGLYLGRSRATLEQLPFYTGFLLVCGSLCLAAVLFIRFDFPRLLTFGLPAVGFVAGMICLERAWQNKPSSVLLFFGDASYSLYLCHLFVISAVLILARRASISWYFSAPLAIALAFAIGALVFTMCERPLIRLLAVRERQPRHRESSALKSIRP
ncbi:acyltransferase [Bradyrhizobium liaoningense]|uniref:acyltransferase family protein n=1 Tax=Bradyrhizobium liaoningense TaxID=43992 RepID=UPI001BAC26C4|nr:acyltransferase [Bradyrhizobium liaoningense]MBR0737667.1 acyltransferase [Bradyrhizobium liaoningense]